MDLLGSMLEMIMLIPSMMLDAVLFVPMQILNIGLSIFGLL
jgi:hypothetical protein